MHVLIVVPWDQRFGGVASVVGNLARHLEAGGHSALFLFPGDAREPSARVTTWGFRGVSMRLREPVNPSFPLRSRLAFWATLPAILARLRALLRSEGVDIVNIHYPCEDFVAFAVLRRMLRFRLVTSVHGGDMFPEGTADVRLPWAKRLLLRSSDLVVAPSQRFLLDTLRVAGRVRGTTTFIHNGIDAAEFPEPEERAPHGAHADILCIAAQNPRKGVDVLLRAFALVSPKYPAVRLTLAGDGPMRGELEALARELGIEGRTEFAGALDRLGIRSLLAGCDVVALPSRTESFGIAAAEAMAAGKPLVASAVGGIPEIVRDGETGFLVPPDQPAALAARLEELVADADLRSRMGRAGRERVIQNFLVERCVASYEARFREVLDGRRAASRRDDGRERLSAPGPAGQ